MFASSSKKRPSCLTIARMFGHKVLDMLEFYLDAESFRSISQFKTKKFAVGLRPMLLFAGTAFESPVSNEYTLAKSLLIDFFRGDSSSDKIDVEGLQYVVAVSAAGEGGASEGPGDAGSRPLIHLRVYLIRTKRSGQKLPRVEVEEMGPRCDFRLGRMTSNAELMKEALKKARTAEERPKKNITTDTIGDKIGRIHLGKQTLDGRQSRKMKGLKRPHHKDDNYEVGAINSNGEKRRKS